jgi:hypothetical protein
LLADPFVPFLVANTKVLGLLIAEITKPKYSSTFQTALARRAQANFASEFIRALAELTDDARLTATIADLVATLNGSNFTARFLIALAQRAQTSFASEFLRALADRNDEARLTATLADLIATLIGVNFAGRTLPALAQRAQTSFPSDFLRALAGLNDEARLTATLADLIATLTGPNFATRFQTALAQGTQAGFASDFLRALAGLARNSPAFDARLGDTISNLIATLTGPDFAARFQTALAQGTQAGFASDFLRALAGLADKSRLPATITDLVTTLITSPFDALFLPALAKQAQANFASNLLRELAKAGSGANKPLEDAIAALVATLGTPPFSERFVPDLIQQLQAKQALRDALVDQLAAQNIAGDMLRNLVQKLWTQKAANAEERAQFFIDNSLSFLVAKAQDDDTLRGKLVTEIKKQPKIVADVCGAPAPQPAVAESELQRFIQQLGADDTFKANFKRKTKDDMIAKLQELAQL